MAATTGSTTPDTLHISNPQWALPKVIPELDGIRGLAILMVLICHSSNLFPWATLRSILRYGYVGVDLFFVLSGFLITGILLDTHGDRHRLRNFYIRRGLRIWPLYFTYLTGSVLLFDWMLPSETHIWAHIFLVQNFVCGLSMQAVLAPTWSLAVEEQFYAVWPWIAFHVKRETIWRLGFVLIACCPLLRLIMSALGATQEDLYVNTFSRLDGLAIGAALAAWVRDPRFEPERMKRFALQAIVLAGTGATFTVPFATSSRFLDAFSYSFVALMSGGIIALALRYQGTANRYAMVFRQSWLVFLGKVSFALYLFNFPVYVLVHGNHGMAAMACLGLSGVPAECVFLIIENGILLSVAWLSWNFFESPLLKLKARLAPR